jgi:uncharacterized membrane protein
MEQLSDIPVMDVGLKPQISSDSSGVEPVDRDVASLNTHRSVRSDSVDFVRGLVMVLMTLDHTRDFFSNATFSPTDLDKSDLGFFFTRWITHFCAPVFVLLAGMSAYFSSARKEGVIPWSRFLIIRGLWLMILEVTWVRFSWVGNLTYENTFLQVIWAIGVSFLVLGATLFINSIIFKKSSTGRPALVGIMGLLIITLHNSFDHVRADYFEWLSPLWIMLHQVGSFQVTSGFKVTVFYPVLAWIGVLFVGFYLGYWWTKNRHHRSRSLKLVGLSCVILFCFLRGFNLYGDPSAWILGQTWQKSLMSFLNTTKYPPSLNYLLMTLGPALIFLGWAEAQKRIFFQGICDLGKVPMFFYLAHLPLIHLGSKIYGVWCLGIEDVFKNQATPQHYGVGLLGVYGATFVMLLMLFPLCRWFMGVKAQNPRSLLRYL